MTTERLPGGEATSGLDRGYAWYRLAVSVVLATVGSFSLWAFVVVLPLVQAEFETDRASATLPYALTMAGFAVGSVIFGRLVDRFGITGPAVAAAVLECLGFVGASMASSIWVFAILHGVLIGIGTAATFGPLIADISHWFRRRLGIAVAAVACGNYLSGTIGPPILRILVESEGWRTSYAILGIFLLLAMVPLALMLRHRTAPGHHGAETATAEPRREIALSPRALQALLALAGFGCCMAMSMPQVHIVAYCADLGYGLARGAEMLSLMLACGVVSRLASGFLADYIGGVRTLLLGSVGQGLALILFLPFDGLTSLYLVSALFGLAQGGIVPCYAIIIREYLPAREAGQRIGIVIMMTIAGMAIGGWLTGWIYDATGSYQAAFLNGIGWNVLNTSIMLTVLWRTGRPRGGLATA